MEAPYFPYVFKYRDYSLVQYKAYFSSTNGGAYGHPSYIRIPTQHDSNIGIQFYPAINANCRYVYHVMKDHVVIS